MRVRIQANCGLEKTGNVVRPKAVGQDEKVWLQLGWSPVKEDVEDEDGERSGKPLHASDQLYRSRCEWRVGHNRLLVPLRTACIDGMCISARRSQREQALPHTDGKREQDVRTASAVRRLARLLTNN